ncbi:MAG: amidohydrolase [Desulfurococcales archaeon]|jgi:predicted amidohydrolase YtcJ
MVYKEKADLVILGRIYTFAKGVNVAEAIAVRGNKIIYVGSRSGVERYINSKTAVIDVEGKGITPGLIDTHAHMAVWGLYRTRYIDLSYPSVDSIKKLVEAVREAAKKKKEGEWILGRGWNQAFYPEGRMPSRWDLDEATTKHPVLLWHTSGHMVVVNSLALEIAGINRNTRSPPGGIIEKDSRGEPTGILAEKPAIEIVERKIPRPAQTEWVEAIRYAMREWVSEGITAVKDPTSHEYTREIIEAYKAIRRGGEQLLRVVALYWAQSLEELWKGEGYISSSEDPWLRVPGIKIILDGAISTRTAWISGKYRGLPETSGLPTLDLGVFREMIAEALSKGYMISVHAIGDIAIEEVIKAYEEALKRGERKSILTVIHFMLPKQDHVERLRAVGGYAEIQGGFIYFLAEAYRKNLYMETYNKILPVRSMLDTGLTVCSGSDAPVIPYPPRYGIYSLVSRLDMLGIELNRGEAISIAQAFATYTSEASKCLGMEDIIGSIEVGKLADIVVWDRDPLSMRDPKELLEIKPLYTIVDGKIIYRGANR